MLGLAQWSFDRGLLQHVNQRASSQYQNMVQPLAKLYQQYGSWAFMNERSHLWEFVKSEANIEAPPASLHPSDRRPSRPDFKSGSQSDNRPHHRDDFSRPPHHERGFRPPRDHDMQGQSGRGGGRDQRPPRPEFHRGETPPRDGSRSQNRPPRPGPKGGEPLALVNSHKEFVIGRLAKPDHRQFIPIKVANETVGYVVYANRERLMDDYDLDFSQELSQNLWWIAAIMVLLSASLALPFSQLLLKPLRPIVSTIHKLATGDLSARVDIKTSDEIGQVGNDVNHLAESLSESDESRKKWLANISHELRTPLAVMRGELEAMLDGIREINREHIESAHQEALHLQRLVEDLYQLTSSDIGALSYHKSDLDFSELVEDDLERFTPLVKQAGLTFTFHNNVENSEHTWVHGDAQRLSQLIHNLVQNSIKYTQAPGKIHIQLSGNLNHIQFTIEDSAPGVQAHELEKIFDHLYRAEASRNRKTGGSGLGLAICKKITEGHGGTLRAHPSPLGGVRMILTLPLLD